MEATNALDAEAIAAAVERDRVAPRSYVVDGFQYIWKNIKKKQWVFIVCIIVAMIVKLDFALKLTPP